MSKLSEFERQLRELASSPIAKIGIISASGMYFHYTEFDDGDLIGSLKNYLSNAKLKKYRETIFTRFKQRRLLGGTSYSLSFTTNDTAELYYLCFFRDRVCRLNGDDEYRIISDSDNPLFTIRRESAKRHGSKRIDSHKFDVSWSNFDKIISEFGEDDRN